MEEDQNIQILTEEHHRRARSIGGTKNPANVSYVKKKPHQSWHILFGNMNAFQICDHLNKIKFKPKNIKIVCKFINGVEVKALGENNSKNERKVFSAWNILFKGMEFKEIIDYINNVWLDPSYHFYIKKI